MALKIHLSLGGPLASTAPLHEACRVHDGKHYIWYLSIRGLPPRGPFTHNEDLTYACTCTLKGFKSLGFPLKQRVFEGKDQSPAGA